MGLPNFRNSSCIDFVFHPNLKSLRMDPLSEILDTDCKGNYQIGMYSSVNRCILGIGGGVGVSTYISDSEIGPYTMIGSRVSIGGFGHPKNWLSVAAFQWGQNITHWGVPEEALNRFRDYEKPDYKKTNIGADCWVGNNAVILSGLFVGEGAIVGAGSVVTKDVPPYAIVVGNPAKEIGYRFEPEIIKELVEVSWWDLPLNELSKLDFKDISNAIRQIKEIRSRIAK